MANAKESKSAPKKAKTEDKPSRKSTKVTAVPKPKVAGLSEERVVDSDSDEDTPDVKAIPDVAKVGRPAKEKKEKKQKAKTAVPIPPPTKVPTPSASDDDDDSESEEDQSSSEESEENDAEVADAPALKKPETARRKVNGVKRKAESVSSLDGAQSSEDESGEDDAKPDAKRVKTALKDAGEVAQVGQAATDEDSDDDSDSDEQDAATKPAAETAPAAKRPQHAGSLGSIPVQSFKPPSGYASVAITSSTFSADSFQGRQIWHIVAPSNVPLKSLQNLSVDAIQSGAVALSYRDTEYSLIEAGTPNNHFDSVIVPGSTSYDGVAQPISKTLHIRQRVSLPKLSKKQANLKTGSSAAADIAQPSIIETRPQPKGMRMRYKPAGFGAGDPGLGSDSEEDNPQAKTNGTTFQFPKALGSHGAATETDKADVPKAKKLKKKRKDSDVEMVNGDAVVSPSAEQPRSTPSATKDSPASIADPSPAKDELSKEERKRRKAEKKERRASKVTVSA